MAIAEANSKSIYKRKFRPDIPVLELPWPKIDEDTSYNAIAVHQSSNNGTHPSSMTFDRSTYPPAIYRFLSCSNN